MSLTGRAIFESTEPDPQKVSQSTYNAHLWPLRILCFMDTCLYRYTMIHLHVYIVWILDLSANIARSCAFRGPARFAVWNASRTSNVNSLGFARGRQMLRSQRMRPKTEVKHAAWLKFLPQMSARNIPSFQSFATTISCICESFSWRRQPPKWKLRRWRLFEVEAVWSTECGWFIAHGRKMQKNSTSWNPIQKLFCLWKYRGVACAFHSFSLCRTRWFRILETLDVGKLQTLTGKKQLCSSVAMALAARARGAILGSLVADAAAVPVHWCYDPEKLAEHLKQACQAAWFRLCRLMFFVCQAKRGPAFCDPPGNNFYTTPKGGLLELHRITLKWVVSE